MNFIDIKKMVESASSFSKKVHFLDTKIVSPTRCLKSDLVVYESVEIES